MAFNVPLPKLALSRSMKWALGVSVAFHLGIVLVGTLGLPYIKKPIVITQPIAVEIVDISDITTTNRPPNPVKTPKAEPKKTEEKKPKIKTPPKVEAKAPPKVDPIKPPKVEETKKPEPKTPPPPEKKVAEKKPDPKPKPPEKKKDDKKEAAAQEEAFLSVLKNLEDSAPETPDEAENAKKAAPDKASPLAAFAEKLSATEVDAIRAALNRQFSGCWNLMAGARDAEDIVVKIRLVVNPDRSVQSARIADQWRYNQDSFYKAAADAALRAVRHPNCAVLDLPPDKYKLWKDMIFNFNPADQL